MEEWYPIDLHMHTVEGITRDKTKDNVNFSYAIFQKILEKYRFGLMAVTNHNIIDMKNYILMRYLAKKYNTNLLMGVELDSSLSMGAAIHIAVICNSTDFTSNFELQLQINNMTERKKKSAEKEIIYHDSEIIDILSKYDVLLIPHGDKDKGIFRDAGKEQIDEALKKISEGFIRIFDNPSKWKLERVKNYLSELSIDNLDDFGGVLFSDVRDWNNYDRSYKDFYMNAEPTFKGLIHAVSNPTKRFCQKKEIRINNNYISKIIIESNSTDRIKPCEITLSPYYNCIIGKSGSGKSLLLHLIKKHLNRGDDQNANYSFANDCTIKIFNEKGKPLDENIINIGIGENLFNKIITASTTKDNDDLYKVTELLNPSFVPKQKFIKFCNQYIKKTIIYYLITKNVETERESLISNIVGYDGDIQKLNDLRDVKMFSVKPFSSFKTTYSKEYIDKYSNYKLYISNLENITKLYSGKYSEQLNIVLKQLNMLLELIELDIKSLDSKEARKNKEIEIINFIINKINETHSYQATQKSLIIQSLPEKRKEILSIIKKLYLENIILNNFDFSIEVENINDNQSINKDGSIIVNETIDNEFLQKVNIKNNGIFKTRGKIQKLPDQVYDLTKKDESLQLIKKYIEVGLIDENGIRFSNDFSPKVSVLFDGQDVTSLNPGDISKKYISMYFNERLLENDNKVILYDQIENDVDKPFIANTISRLIEDTKGNVQMIVVTHDPIVAVNADPNRYIISEKDEEQRISYRSFVIESSVNDEIKTISDVVDGSTQVIRKRYEIYKGETKDD